MIMFKKLLLSGVIFAVLVFTFIGSASAGQYDYVEPPEYLWSCFDYAMNYSQMNPEWGIVLVSDHPRFRGVGNSHFVNYQIDEGILYIYDSESGFTARHLNWWDDSFTYYHFYMNGEVPTRYFRYELPNAMEVYNAL